jgi:hypothetical protein
MKGSLFASFRNIAWDKVPGTAPAVVEDARACCCASTLRSAPFWVVLAARW